MIPKSRYNNLLGEMLLRNNFPSGDTVHMICLYKRTEFLIKINRFRATTDDPEYQK